MRDFFNSTISVISHLRFRTPTPNEGIAYMTTLLLANLPGAQGWEIGTGAAATIGVGGFCGVCICCLWVCSSCIEQNNNQNQNVVRREQLQQPLLQPTTTTPLQVVVENPAP